MIKNKTSMIGIILLFGILLIGGVEGLGITPGRTTINFEAGAEKIIPISVLNNNHENMEVVLSIEGDLSDSISVSTGKLEFLPSEESKSFNYKIDLPENLEPGTHKAEIKALKVSTSEKEGTYVGATVAVVTQVHVRVPYPGKYPEFDLNVLEAKENGTATFIIPVVNRGEVGIGEARAVIDIYTSLNEKVGSVETDYREIGAGKRTELSGKWMVDVPSGDYLAKVTVFYDGESRQMEKQFAVGKKKLDINSILVNNFQLGEIAKLQILVENKWNKELEDVMANLLVYNKKDQVMADVKSASETVPALSKKELIAYWDTVGVREGEYNGKLMVKYGEKSSDKNLVLDVSENNLDIKGVGYAIRPSGEGGFDITTLLIILVIIMLIANLAWFVFYKRIMSGRKK